jgi:methyl-accepting chemotaxis protein
MTNEPTKNNPLSIVQRAVFPATSLLRRLKFFRKFAVMGILLLIPLLFVAWLQYSGTTDDIEFNRAEHVGMLYLDPVHDFIGAQQVHWVASVARARGISGMAAIETESAQQVAAFEKAVDTADSSYGKQLKASARWAECKSAWQRALASSKDTPAAIDRAHAEATAATADLIINYIANNSNLILDPDLDSYWLMDFATVKGPLIGNQLAAQTTRAIQDVGDKSEYAYTLSASIASGLGAVNDTETVNLKTAIESTKNFGKSATLEKNLLAPFGLLKSQANSLANDIKSKFITTVFAPGATATPAPADGATPSAPAAVATVSPAMVAAVVQSSISTLDKNDKFYDAVLPELDGLIQKRVSNYSSTRFTGLLLTLLGILLLFYIFAGFYFGMTELVSSLNGATTRMIKGTDEKFATENRDETAGIVTNFNEINGVLVEARQLTTRVQDENAATQKSIFELLKVVSDASDGDLTTRAVTGSGALGNVADAFNLLMESLEGLIGDVTKQVAASDQAVQSISEVAKRMSTGAAEQTREVLAARTLVDDVAKQISNVSNDAQGATSASKHTAATAQDGEKAVANVIAGMDSLRSNVQSGAKKMKNLGDRTMEITSIVETITRISEQTNMLALNAAIEGARAGEHGRGFRVVADEVRKLAERASIATKDIEKLVKAITAETNETIRAIEQQTQVVEEESKTVGVAGESLRAIRVASDSSMTLVAQINAVAQQQVTQTQRVVKSMESVSATAAETAKGAETTVSTVANLVRLSNELRTAIGKFRIGGAN